MEQHIQPLQPMFFRGKTKIIAIAFIAVILGIGIYFWMKNQVAKPDEQQNTQTQNQSSSFSDNDSVSAEINPRDYSLVDYPLKESLIYDQLKNLELKARLKQSDKSGDYGNTYNAYEFCFDPNEEPWTVQKDTRLVKNTGEIIIPSIRQLIFASESIEPNCVTKIGLFFAPTDRKYLYLTVSELSIKEFMNWPIYRLDLSNLSVEKLTSISTYGIIDSTYDERVWMSNYNKVLFDGKRAIHWNEKDVFLVDLEKDSSSVIYTASDNQWLASNADFDTPQGGIFADIENSISINQDEIIIDLYDKNETSIKKISTGGTRTYYNPANQVTIPVPAN